MFFKWSIFKALLPVLAVGAMMVMISSQATDPNAPATHLLKARYKNGKPVVKILNWIKVCVCCGVSFINSFISRLHSVTEKKGQYLF